MHMANKYKEGNCSMITNFYLEKIYVTVLIIYLMKLNKFRTCFMRD